MAVEVREILHADDRLLPGVVALLRRVLADPNLILPLARFQQLLGAPRGRDGLRTFHAFAAVDEQAAVVGAVVFSYIRASGCGFSEYLAVAPDRQRTGVARTLIDARRATLDADARAMGQPACRGLFVETESPDRTPAAFVEAERAAGTDVLDRLRFFRHLGFRRASIPYVQPPLADGQKAVDYLDLLFLPWDPAVRARGTVPAEWVLQTVEPVWQGWSPGAANQHLRRLRLALAERPLVKLDPLV